LDVTIDGEVIHTTDEHPFFVVKDGEGKWVKAKDVGVGDVIFNTMGQDSIVESVEVVDEPQLMYNLSVQLVASYFVGDGQWLVHNIEVYRFASIGDTKPPITTYPSGIIRQMVSIASNTSIGRQILAEMHLKGGSSRLFSPFVSLTTDLDKMTNSFHPTIRSIVSGFPNPEMRAPNIGVFEVPENRLYYLDNPEVQLIGEVLFLGDDLDKYQVGEWRTNPYQREDTGRWSGFDSCDF
jgi:hypothetical protein